MNTFTRFLYEFLSQFLSGFIIFFKGIVKGAASMFKIKAYISIINDYKQDFNGPEWLMVGIAILIVVVITALIVILIL